MKKVWISVATVVVAVLLAACSAKVTNQGLAKKDWLTNEKTDGVTVGLNLHFTENKVTVSPKVVAIDIDQVPEEQKTLGESFYRSQLEEQFKDMITSGNYTLDDGQIQMKLKYPEDFEEKTNMSLPKEGSLTFDHGQLVLTTDSGECHFKPVEK